MAGEGPESGGGQPPTGTPAAVPVANASIHAFISYASQDKAVADAVCQALERASVVCWIAPRDVVPGESYAGAIVHAIDATKLIVLILSENAASSQHVLREVERASSKRHPVVAFRIDLAPMPADLEYFLNTSQWLDASTLGVERALPKLVDAVRRIIAPGSIISPEPVGSAPKPVANLSQRSPVSKQSRHALSRPVLALGVLVALGLAYFAVDKLRPARHTQTERPTIAVSNTVSEKSIAVLPFVDMSEMHDQEYFADGLSEELIDLLARLPQLQVIARTSSFSFKGKSDDIPTIGRRLNVANILEGSVRKSGSRLRVTTQLIRADNSVHIWSDTYERDLKDVFMVQDEIAGAVVAALKIHLLPSQQLPEAHRTQNTEAYNLYLQGRQFAKRSTDDDWHRAIEAYGKAIELDPNFAAAYAGLAVAQVWAAEKHDEELRAIPSAEKAVELAPEQAEGYVARGFVRQDVNWDWQGAMADFEKALRLAPGDSDAHSGYARLLIDLGRMKEGVAEASKAAGLDPLSSTAWQRLAVFQLANREFSAAHEANRRALEISPEDPRAQLQLGVLLLREGRFPEAIAAYRKVSIDVFRLVGLAMAEHSLGHTKESQQAFEEIIAKYAASDPSQVAWVYAWRGERNKAFEWLERAYREHDNDLTTLKWSPFVDSLRGDPRFGAMLKKMNLTE